MKKSRLVALITALCLIFCMGASFAMPAAAEEPAKQELYTAEDLLAVAAGDMSGSYILKADIDLKGAGYTPIGTVNNPFTGTFDGNGYTISGLYLESDGQYQGLFGVNNGTIRNVTLSEDCFISGSAHVGAIAGRNNGTIEGCLSYAAVSHTAKAEAGGNTYSIMSQNLCQWGEDDLSANPNFQDGVAYSRKVVMEQRIRNADPDIMLFQEVYFVDRTKNGKKILAWSTFLKNTFGSTYNFYGDYRSTTDKEGILVAIKKSKFDYVDDACFWLSTNPDAPRSQQSKAWDASHVRTCHWVLARDKTTGQEIAAYSTHLDVGGAVAREKGAQLIADRMAQMKSQHPNALIVVGGDFNENPGAPGYVNIDNAMGGMMDDGRYVAEVVENNYSTSGGINDLELTGAHNKSIDFIFADTDKAEVDYFKVMNDNYFDLRPSDHQGVLIKVRAIENNFVGGIAGSNNGTISSVVNAGAFDGGNAEGTGDFLGSCDYNSVVKVAYSKTANLEKCIALEGIRELKALPAEPSYDVVANLNNQGSFFVIEDGKYAIAKECGDKVLADVIVNGITYCLPVGSVYEPDFDIPEGALVLLDGEPYDGRPVIVPAEGFRIVVATSVANAPATAEPGDYTIANEAEWMYVYNNLSRFKNRNITLHLMKDIDLSSDTAKNFKGFTDPAFSFDGHGHTVKNWGAKGATLGANLFRATTGDGGMYFLRNLTLENCHVSGNLAAVLYAAYHGNGGLAGLPTTLSISGITIKNCSVNAASQGSAMVLSRYGVTNEAFTVNIRDCKVTGSYLNANSNEHIGLIVGKPREAGKASTYNISDCFLADNEIVNAKEGVGFVCGSAETNTNVNIHNVGIFRNRASGASGSEFHYICGDSYCSGVISADKLMIAGNTVSTSSVYMISGVSDGAASDVPTNYYSDANLTAVSEGVSATYSQTALYAFQLGAVGYMHNQDLVDPAFYWAMDEANYYRPAPAEERVAGVSYDGHELYINGGSQYDLGAPDQGKWMVTYGESTLNGNILTVAGDITIVSQVQRVSQVPSAVTGGDYTVEDITDWMFLYNNLSRFQSRNVTIHLLCDIDLSAAEASSFKGFANPAFSFDGHGHTIKNWGSKNARKAYQALFYATEGAGGMEYIKNLKVSNCHVGAASGFGAGAIVFSSINGNDGFEGLAPEFTLENIHIQGCSLQSPGESSGMLLSRYGVAGNAFDVNIKNCSVVGCELDAGGSAHKGMLVGKPRCTNSKGTFNITDCYVADNIITNTVNGAGVLFGTAEGSNTVMNITNVAAVNNTIIAKSDYTEGAYLGYSDNGKVNLDRVILNANTVNAENKYLVATNGVNNQTFTMNEVYSDITSLTSVLEITNKTYTLPSQAALIASGEAAYLLNEQADGEMYWRVENGLVKGGDQDHRATKLIMMLNDGTILKTRYDVSGCQQVDLALNEDPEATFAAKNDIAINGSVLQVPAGAKEILVSVIPSENSPLNPDYVAPVTSVTEAVSMGTYSVSDIEEWMYLFNHQDYFASENITIVLLSDLDLSDGKAASFSGFSGAKFSLNGNEYALRNWNYTATKGDSYLGGLFMKYAGKSIKNLKIENFNVAGTYGRSILVAGFDGTGNLTIENVHVKDSELDTTNTGGHMGIFLSRALNDAATGASITLRNCSAINADLQNTAQGRINNSGLLIGTAYKGYSYIIENCLIQGCEVNTDTGAGGFVVGAVEISATKLRMNRVAIYDCSARVASTNECPGVFIGEMSQYGNATITNCMAANLSVEGGKSLSFLRHSDVGGAATFSVSNCLVDFEPVEIKTADNIEGVTSENKGAIAGATKISSAAFKSGEAAWLSTKGATANRWWVDDSFAQYPTFYKEEGYGAPYKVTFGSESFYTNGSGLLPASASAYLEDDGGLWKNGSEQVTAATVYTADTALTFESHTFLPQNAVADGDGFHKIPCSDSGCSAIQRVVCSYTNGIAQSAKEGVHVAKCICGNGEERACSLEIAAGNNGTHYEKCDECGAQTAAVACNFSYTPAADGRHVGKCEICDYSAEADCSFGIVSCGDGYHYEKCGKCGNEKAAEQCALAYITKDGDLHAEKCATCGYETQAEACDYEISHVAGTNTHKEQCTLCDRVKSTVGCSYEIVSHGDGYHHEECSVCKHQKDAVACSFSYSQKEGDLHAKECGICHYRVEDNCDYSFVSLKNGSHYEKCTACGKEKEPVACVYDSYVHIPGTNTHKETCSDCGHEIADAECIMRAKAGAIPEAGDSFSGILSCTKDCGNHYQNIVMKSGDLNNDGRVGIADVICILQVIAGIRSADSVQSALGDLYQADGVTENGGLTVMDAIILLRSILQK